MTMPMASMKIVTELQTMVAPVQVQALMTMEMAFPPIKETVTTLTQQ